MSTNPMPWLSNASYVLKRMRFTMQRLQKTRSNRTQSSAPVCFALYLFAILMLPSFNSSYFTVPGTG